MKRVLILVEDPELRGTVRQALDGEYMVSELSSVEEACRHLKEYKPDLMILSETFKEQDGMEVMGYLRKLPGGKELPALFLVRADHTDFERRVYRFGASDLVTLPCSEITILYRAGLLLELIGYRTNALEFIEYQEAISVSIAELVECRDITTGGHLKNTTAYFKLFLEELISREQYRERIPEEDVRDLIRSAPLHDIGKIGINDEILRKASALDDNEFEYMKTHTVLGKETFEKIMKETGENRFLLLAKDLAYCHHERWDGTGYPNGLKGESIPFYARILAIADVYDALTSRRAYKEAFSHPDAVEIIRGGRGTLFDPELVDIFIEINDRFEQALKTKYRNGA